MALTDRIQLALSYGASYAAWAAQGEPRPFSASFAVTNRCNLRCSYCNFPLLPHAELDLDQIAVLFDRLRDMGVVRLGLVGGEPLVRKDIGAIVALGRARDFFISLNSNLMLYRHFEEAFESVDLVFTSIDATPDAHRANRGEDSLDGVIEAIRALRARDKPVVPICVVNEHTVGEAMRLLDLADELDVRVHFQPQCMDTEIVRGQLSREVSSERLRLFWRDLLHAKRAGRRVGSSTGYLEFLSGWQDFFVSAFHDAATRCAAGRGFLFVDPVGDAFPCAYTKGKTPPVNLLTHDWRTDWNGKTPCTECSVGPMLEFNLLFRRPVRSVLDAARSYL